jgi:hypothetical protein
MCVYDFPGGGSKNFLIWQRNKIAIIFRGKKIAHTTLQVLSYEEKMSAAETKEGFQCSSWLWVGHPLCFHKQVSTVLE